MSNQKKIKAHRSCYRCPSLCCNNLAMEIGRPTNKAEVEDLKWQLQFDTVKVFIRHRRWHLLVKGVCMYLSKSGLCTIYDQRPERCRKYNPPECERHGKFYDRMITTPKQLERYLETKKNKPNPL